MSRRRIFYLSFFLYLFVAPFAFHPDIKTIFYQTQFLTKGVFNIYSFFSNNLDKSFLGPFVYPPLAYFIYGLIFIPVKLIAGRGFVDWLAMGNQAVFVQDIFQYLFAIKLPSIFFHFATALVLTKFFDGEEQKRKLLLFWFFNPVSIYTVGLMGQIDILPVFLTVLSLFYARSKPLFSAILLGIGAAVKTYPLILLPFFSFVISKNWRERIKYMAFGILPYILVIFPFLKTASFYSSTFISGLSQRIFEPRINLGFAESILIIPAVLIFLLINSLQKNFSKLSLCFYFLAVTLLISVGVHFHPQWILWSLAFLTIFFVEFEKKYKSQIFFAIYLFLIGFLGTILFFDDKFLTWGILSPLDEEVLLLPTLSSLSKPLFDSSLIQSLFHTLMVASGAWILIKAFREYV